MRSVHPCPSLLIPTAALCIALGLPATVEAAPPSAVDEIAAVKASPALRRTLSRAQLKSAGLAKFVVNGGAEVDIKRFVEETALDRQPELKPLFDPKVQARALKRAPIYSESIYELEDRLVIERKLTVVLNDGACAGPGSAAAAANLCFHRKTKGAKASPGIDADLAAIRAKLAKAPANKIVVGTVTVAQARKLSNERLLDLLLNSSPRTVHHVSVVPRQLAGAVKTPTPKQFTPTPKQFTPAPKQFTPLPKQLTPMRAPLTPDSGLILDPYPGKKPPLGGVVLPPGPESSISRKYFLTGFTLGREIEDNWELTFADETWLTDRYFVRVQYNLGLGFGVRAPFSVDVRHAGIASGLRNVEMVVKPVNVDTAGRPAYPAVGLASGKYFDGKEFVLEFKAGCSLYVSIPGPNIDERCPSIDLGYSRDVNPVIGGARSKIQDWWLDGKVTGLALDFGAANASIDVGIGAEITNGAIGVRVNPLGGSTFSNLNPGKLTLRDSQPVRFTVKRTKGTPAFRLSEPRYAFDIDVTPKLRAKVEVDVAVYENTWVIGPFPLTFLTIGSNFQLDHHEGTVTQHDFLLNIKSKVRTLE